MSRRRPPAAAPKPKSRKPKPPPTVGRDAKPEQVLIPTFGRKPKPITAALIDDMCRVIRAGGNVDEAALVAGISRAHFFNWQNDARVNPTPEKQDYLDALDDAKRGRSLRMKLRYQALAKDDPKALQWWMERDPTTREEFRPPKVTVLVEQELSRALDALCTEFASEPDTLDRVLAAIAGAHGGGETGGDEDGEGGGDDPAGGEAVHPPLPKP